MGGVTHRARWNRRLDAVCADPSLFRLVLHPVVDIAAGRIAGYEVLSRFPSTIPTAYAPSTLSISLSPFACVPSAAAYYLVITNFLIFTRRPRLVQTHIPQ